VRLGARSKFLYYPMKVGDYVHIKEGSIVQAASIGSHVQIGRNCVIVRRYAGWGGRIAPTTERARPPATVALSYWNWAQGNFAKLSDGCIIEDNAFVPPAAVVPPFAVYGGAPGA